MQELYNKYLECNGNIITDTREISENCIFFALKGDTFNGNNFSQKAIELGARYSVVDDPNFALNDDFILVDDVLDTLQKLALYHREKLKTPIIAITGSNGKTTTKELLYKVLSRKYKTHYTKGNLNNHIGIPITLLKMQKDDDIAIIEMGANHIGEIEAYTKFVKPNYGLITNIGFAHLEGFGSFEGVQRAKKELYKFLMNKKSLIFLNIDDQILKNNFEYDNVYTYSSFEKDADTYGIINLENNDSTLSLDFPNNGVTINTNLNGEYNLYNVLASVAIGLFFNININEIKAGIESYIPKNNRSEVLNIKESTIFLDAYNANPSSMQAALLNLSKTNGHKVALLGAMKELGIYSEEEHLKIASLAIDLGIDKIALVGDEFKNVANKLSLNYFSKNLDSKEWIQNFFEIKSTILIKGSRLTALEKVLEQ